jgi:hypothetical protein
MLRRSALKRKSPMRTKTGLRTGQPLARKTGLRPVNPARRAKRFAEQFHSDAFVSWVHSLACAVPGCQRTDIEAAHVGRTRARGGTWQEVAPLCAPHHREQEGRSRAFGARYGIDLDAIAAAVAQRWMAFCAPIPTRLLPCERCSAPGPHAALREGEGGWTALCAGCESEVGQDARQDGSNRLHGSPRIAGA